METTIFIEACEFEIVDWNFVSDRLETTVSKYDYWSKLLWKPVWQGILSLKICRNNCHLPPPRKLAKDSLQVFWPFRVTNSKRNAPASDFSARIKFDGLYGILNWVLHVLQVQQNANELREKQRRNSSGENFVRHGYAFEIVTCTQTNIQDVYRDTRTYESCIGCTEDRRECKTWLTKWEKGQHRNITKIERPVDINCVKCGS